jgi:hypothetical protein
MTELSTLHPLDPAVVDRYLAAIAREETGDGGADLLVPADPTWSRRLLVSARRGYAGALAGRESGANAVSYGLAQLLATAHPTFYLPGASFSLWEARIDRGLGMLLRPPSRLFGEAGLAVPAARAMPIRLDLGAGLMGGAFIPARLVPELERQLDARAERLVRRLLDAELDGVAVLGLVMEATAYASDRGLGLFEATDVVVPEAPEGDPPGAVVIGPDRKRLAPALRHRLEEAAKPPKKPSLADRLFRRGGKPTPDLPG